MKFGYFGGSFDPIHYGHLIAAQDALEQLHLDAVYFVPTAQAPLRENVVQASAEDRLEMIRLAVGEDSRFRILESEIARGGTSYTFDTVSALREREPGTTPIWIIGEDQVGKLPQWRRIEELCALAEFAFLQRPGHSQPPVMTPLPGVTLHPLKSHQVEISSSEIRQRTREKRPLRFLLPDPVIKYIHERNLYQ